MFNMRQNWNEWEKEVNKIKKEKQSNYCFLLVGLIAKKRKKILVIFKWKLKTSIINQTQKNIYFSLFLLFK